jgi:DNA invertase Pin-like site-specific DNA recombinase
MTYEEPPSDEAIDAMIERWADQQIARLRGIENQMGKASADLAALATERAEVIGKLRVRFSVAEIANRLAISRQTVYDVLKRPLIDAPKFTRFAKEN